MPPAELFYSFLLTQIFTSLFESSAVNEEADEKKVSLLPKATQKINEEDLQKNITQNNFTIYFPFFFPLRFDLLIIFLKNFSCIIFSIFFFKKKFFPFFKPF